MKTFGRLIARWVGLGIIILVGCGCSVWRIGRPEVIQHGIDDQRFEAIEDKLAEADLPRKLHGILDTLTSEEISRVVDTNMPELAVGEIRLRNDFSRGSRVYRLILSPGDKITPDEFADIASGDVESSVTLEEVAEFIDDTQRMGAVIPYSSEGILRAVRNLCIGSMIEAVRDRTKTIDLKQVNAVLLQPHWRHNTTAEPTEPVLIPPRNLPTKS